MYRIATCCTYNCKMQFWGRPSRSPFNTTLLHYKSLHISMQLRHSKTHLHNTLAKCCVNFFMSVRYAENRFSVSLCSVSFWLNGYCGEWEGGPVNQVNHTSWVAVVTPTDRPKSVRNCCFIELFCGVVCVVTFPFWHFCWCRGFCHRTGSDLLLFISVSRVSEIPCR